MNGPNRSAAFRNGQPVRRGRASVLDELDSFVDSEPTGWSPLREAKSRTKPAEPVDAPAREERREPAFSKRRRPTRPQQDAPSKTGSSRVDAFAKRLDEQLSQPRPTPAPPLNDFAVPEATAPVGSGTAAPPASNFAPEPVAPPVGPVLGEPEFAQPPAAEPPQTPPQSEPRTGRIPPAPPIHELDAAPDPLVGASEHFDDGLPQLELNDPGEPDDALDWEFKNAFSAIVSGQGLPKSDTIDAAPTPEVVAQPIVPEPTQPDGPPPAKDRTPKAVVSERKAKPVPSFRFHRADDEDAMDAAIPTDADELINSLYMNDARSALDTARPDTASSGLSELDDDEDDDDFIYDEVQPKGRHVPNGQRQRAKGRSGRARSVGIAAVVASFALLGVAGVVGFNVLAGGGEPVAEGPPVVRADARDVKIRADNSQPQAEPDIIARTAVRDEDGLVRPATVTIPAARQALPSTAEEAPPERRRVQTVVVRPDGTLVPAASAARDAAARRAASAEEIGVRTVRDVGGARVVGQPVGDEPVQVAALPAQDEPDFSAPPARTATENVSPQNDAATADRPLDPAAIGVPRRRPAAPASARRSQPSTSGPVDLARQRTAASTNAAPARTSAPARTASAPWAVQVSSQRSRSDAERSFSNLQRRYPNILGGANPLILQANVPGRGTFYRVRLAANSRGEAASLCQRLKSAGADCFIGRN